MTTTIGIFQGKSPLFQVWLVINTVVVNSNLPRDLGKPRNQSLCDSMVIVTFMVIHHPKKSYGRGVMIFLVTEEHDSIAPT